MMLQAQFELDNPSQVGSLFWMVIHRIKMLLGEARLLQIRRLQEILGLIPYIERWGCVKRELLIYVTSELEGSSLHN